MKTIYLVAPSFGCTTYPYDEKLKLAIKNLKKLGFNLILGENIFKSEGLASSNTSELRGKEINDAFRSNADYVLSVGGGETMITSLPYIDFNLIKNNPKTFIGFSDNTNLTYPITTMFNIKSLYAVNATAFFKLPLEVDAKDTLDLLNGKKIFESYPMYQKEAINPMDGYNLDSKTNMKVFNYNSPFKGILLGGCLDCLIGLLGSKYDNTINFIEHNKDLGIIFYIEACDLSSVGVIRALQSLENAGWFNNYINGFIIGRSFNINDESFGINMETSYLSILKKYNKPIIFNTSLGHLGPSLPMLNGAYAKVSYSDNKMKIEYLE